MSMRFRAPVAGAVMAMIFTVAAAGAAHAQQLFVYPKKGQSQDQQQRDEMSCAKWAKSQSGVDPSAPPPPPAPGARAGSTLGGAARGAALGAAVGAIAGNAGKGAAAGSVVGGAAGHRRGRERQAAAQSAELNAYQRAFAACMESRGYTVR